MVAAGIMCQIYSMKGFLRKLSSGKNVIDKNLKKKKKDIPSPFFCCIPSQERVFESTLNAYSNVSVYHPSLCHIQTAKLHLLNQNYSPYHPSFFNSLLLSVSLQYLSVRVTCQFSNEGVDINP